MTFRNERLFFGFLKGVIMCYEPIMNDFYQFPKSFIQSLIRQLKTKKNIGTKVLHSNMEKSLRNNRMSNIRNHYV